MSEAITECMSNFASSTFVFDFKPKIEFIIELDELAPAFTDRIDNFFGKLSFVGSIADDVSFQMNSNESPQVPIPDMMERLSASSAQNVLIGGFVAAWKV